MCQLLGPHAALVQRGKLTARYLHGREKGLPYRINGRALGVGVDETKYGKGDDDKGEEENDD